jgi:hypothetical protein
VLVCHFTASAKAMLTNAAAMIQDDHAQRLGNRCGIVGFVDIAGTYSCLILQHRLDDKAAMR